ncbi:hypothetical protein ANO11243_033150 [Dothideomycetidae sp. 11243]|nr:hypothetical protein ANO11243_033150 [fungal sp. No.11243]
MDEPTEHENEIKLTIAGPELIDAFDKALTWSTVVMMRDHLSDVRGHILRHLGYEIEVPATLQDSQLALPIVSGSLSTVQQATNGLFTSDSRRRTTNSAPAADGGETMPLLAHGLSSAARQATESPDVVDAAQQSNRSPTVDSVYVISNDTSSTSSSEDSDITSDGETPLAKRRRTTSTNQQPKRRKTNTGYQSSSDVRKDRPGAGGLVGQDKADYNYKPKRQEKNLLVRVRKNFKRMIGLDRGMKEAPTRYKGKYLEENEQWRKTIDLQCIVFAATKTNADLVKLAKDATRWNRVISNADDIEWIEAQMEKFYYEMLPKLSQRDLQSMCKKFSNLLDEGGLSSS